MWWRAMKIRDALARGLRSVRTERGMTQAELAERADLHVQFISQLERRQRGVTLENIDALAEALGSTGPELIAIGAGKTTPRSDKTAVDHRIREVISAWPANEQDRLVKVLVALGHAVHRKTAKKPRKA